MKQSLKFILTFLLVVRVLSTALSAPTDKFSWRYFRPGNTGIQGDYNETIWIGPDNDPWIGGYNPIAEEGGIAKFIQAENRWFNVSNVDYSVIGNANEVGVSRATDIIDDGHGNLWIGTWRGVLRMNLLQGPKSLVKFGPLNSTLPGGMVADCALAPDGTLWFSGDNGLNRYNPTTNVWTSIPGHGGDKIAAQPKSGGGYYIWTSPPGYIQSNVDRWDSTTNTWTSFAPIPGNPSHLVSKQSVDASGNLWIRRWFGIENEERLDCLRPNGTWVAPPLPPPNGNVSVAALHPFGNLQALMVDGFMQLQQFNGSTWTNLGPVPHSSWIDDLDRDVNGNVWLCGTGKGGALRRDAVTGFWQRYRVTNTSQFDFFNIELALDPHSKNVFATANASSGIGGMVKFDGNRWTGYVTDLGYGLTGPWPFPGCPQSEAVYVRPSNGRVVANPINNFSHEFDGTSWTQLSGGPDQVGAYVEDSLGRLWCTGHYGGVGYFQNGMYNFVESSGWSSKVMRDPKRPGTVWVNSGYEIVRTDGNNRFSKGIGDFPDLAAVGAFFQGLAVDSSGTVWVGTYAPNTTAGSALIKINPNTGVSQVVYRYGVNWPFRGQIVQPMAFTPDGRLWMLYSKEYPFDDMGLCWWDGRHIGNFPAPPNGEWRFGGLPHYIINDLEVRSFLGGYELWMTCYSRGIAVLTVRKPVGNGR